MGFSINTNLDALNTYKNLSGVQNSLSKSLEKLSSGLRINNAGDDAAGLTIATQLGSQISGLQQASRNAQDGVSLVQTADGALSEAQNILGRLRDLAVQAANDSNSDSARGAIGTEATALTQELGRLSTAVTFNGKSLLNSSSSLTFQVGANKGSDNQITVGLSNANLSSVVTAVNSASSASYTVTGGSASAATYTFKTGNTSVNVTTTAAQSTTAFATTLNNTAEFASAFSASVDNSGALIVTSKLGTTMSAATAGGSVGVGTVTPAALDFTTATGAQNAIDTINSQLANITTQRAAFGALENRFASAVSTISTSVTNLTAAKSRITDVDMASEMVNYSRANILSQSGTAMLAQANSLPQLALKLLG